MAENPNSANAYGATPVVSCRISKNAEQVLIRYASKIDDDDDDFAQYERVTKKCLQTEEEKTAGVKYLTAWFYSEAGYSLSAPPAAMTKHPRLEVGDIFFHIVTHLEDPQMWLWTQTASGRRIWKQIAKGETRREDKRRLTVTWDAKKNTKKPNWVTESWYKKMKDSPKAQGKGKAPGEYFYQYLPSPS